MWIRTSMWDRCVELGVFDHWVLTTRSRSEIEHWLQAGFALVGEERLWGSIHAALTEVRQRDVAQLWSDLWPWRCGPAPASARELARELVREARGPGQSVFVLERLIERGQTRSAPLFKSPPLPARTSTEHYIVIEAVSQGEPPAPVAGLCLELLIADGEVKTAQTDSGGVARVERIQAGSVVIRVLDLDGALWRPAEGAASQLSGGGERKKIHVARQGDCLARIAHQYGLKSWKQVWDDPKNERLRKKRKDPNVLLPGDEVAVPGVPVHEITRPTDATHRLIVDNKAELELELILEGLPAEPLADHPCVLRYEGPGGPVTREGLRLDGEGRLRVTLPIQVREVEVELVELGDKLVLRLGELDPAADAETGEHELTGVQQRLWALGYGPPPTGKHDQASRGALAAFQRSELDRADATGEIDAATCEKLEEYYGV